MLNPQLTFEVITEERTSENEWERLCASSKYASSFQSLEWGRIVERSLGGKFYPIIACNSREDSFLIPVFTGAPWSRVNEFRIGSVGYAGPCPVNESAANCLFENNGSVSILNSLENFLMMRCGAITTFPDQRWQKQDISSEKISYTQRVVLPSQVEDYFNNVATGNVRTAVRKAEKLGVRVRKLRFEELANAHAVLNQTQDEVGSLYKTPLRFLEEIYKATSLRSLFLGAFYEDTMLAFGLFLLHANESFHLFHGWNRAMAHLCPNQALLYAAIVATIQRRISIFNFGESSNKELSKAKARWGGAIIPVMRGSISTQFSRQEPNQLLSN